MRGTNVGAEQAVLGCAELDANNTCIACNSESALSANGSCDCSFNYTAWAVAQGDFYQLQVSNHLNWTESV